jgi:hypothetical protein
MPAGTDLVTWNPRKGDTGDDRYSLPDEETVFTPGGRDQVVSDPPSLDDVNNAYGWWQILLELARRIPNYKGIYSTSLAYRLPEIGWPLRKNWNSSNRSGPQRYSIQEMRLDTEVIRMVDQYSRVDYSPWPTYPWQDPYPSSGPMSFTKTMIFDFRKALATDCITVNADNDDSVDAEGNPPTMYQRSDAAGTGWELPASFLGNPYWCGMLWNFNTEGRWRRIRAYRRFKIPTWIPTLSASQIVFRTWYAISGYIYKAPYMSIVPDNWGTLGSLEATWSASAEKPKITAITTPTPGEEMTYILTSPNEISGTKTDDHNQVHDPGNLIQLRLYTA